MIASEFVDGAKIYREYVTPAMSESLMVEFLTFLESDYEMFMIQTVETNVGKHYILHMSIGMVALKKMHDAWKASK